MAVAETVQYTGRDVRLAGERWEGDGRGVVLLLHGGGQTRHAWSRTAQRLAEQGWTAIALDARGHGDSAWDPAGDYSMDAFADDLRAVVATLEEPPVLVGASLGGMTSMVAAGETPGLARAVVLVDVVVDLEPAGVSRIYDFMSAHPEGFASLEDVAEAIAAYTPQRRRTRNLDGVRKNVRQGADGRWRWHWDPAFVNLADEPRRLLDPARLRAAAQALDIPVLIVHGARSDVVSPRGIADMLELVPDAEVADVAAAGHMVAGDDNDIFVGALGAFLDRL